MELLVVLAVIGLLVGMGTPALVGYTKDVRLKATLRKVIGLVSLARSVSISSQAPHRVVLDDERGELYVINAQSGETREELVKVPSGITVGWYVGGEPADPPELEFRPTGGLAGRTVTLVLATPERERAIVVTGTTGSVTVE